MRNETRSVLCGVLGLLIGGCSVDAGLVEDGLEIGLLEVDLQHLGEDGTTYHLRDATLRVTGNLEAVLAVDDGVILRHSLPPGDYDLELLEGWYMERDVEEATESVEAQLVSANPAAFAITEGEVTSVTLVFEISGAGELGVKTGDLAVDMEVRTASDNPDPEPPGEECTAVVVINEVDYEQPGTDEGEFVELFNNSGCAVSTEGLELELINGAEGEATVYASVDLSKAGAEIPADGYLVLGAESVLAAIPEQALGIALSPSIQNGSPDGMRLIQSGQTLDSLSYGGIMDGITEGQAAPEDGGEGSIARCADGADTDDNATDFAVTSVVTPGSPNQCSDADG